MRVLSKKRALVTGASGGLGAEIAVQLARHGCHVHLVGRSKAKLEKVLERINSVDHFWGPHWLGQDTDYSVVDFASIKQIEKFVDGKPDYDILVNCAGVFPIIDLCSSELEDYDQCFNVNVRAPFLLSKYCAEYMKNSGWGRIVNIASSSAYAGSADTGLYCASKHALLGLSRSLYLELKPHNIRVYTISPGSIQTEMGATDTRQDYDTFLDPKEIAEYVIQALSQDKQMISEEVRLNRVTIR